MPDSTERATDLDGMHLYYPRDFPMMTGELRDVLPWECSRYGLRIADDICSGNVPVRAYAETLSVGDIVTYFEERNRRLEEAVGLLQQEVDKMLPPVPFGMEYRPMPQNRAEEERVLSEALLVALDSALVASPKSYQVMCEHALGKSLFALSIVTHTLNIHYAPSERFEDALESHMRKHLKRLRKTSKP
jgi:hypothetical protein